MPEDKGVGLSHADHTAWEVSLRPFEVSDLLAVLEIENVSFPAPWKPEYFLNEMNNPYARLVVAERAGQVIGYFCCWLVADEVHILDVAVHPDHRRCGVGSYCYRTFLLRPVKMGLTLPA